MRVLIADDSATIRACIRDMLEEIDHVDIVAEASSADEAIELIESQKPDVAVLDIRMPGGGGLEVLRVVREKAIPAVTIMLTNYPYPEYRRKCMEAGAEFFFDKSSEFDRIPNVLRMLMEGRDVRESSRHVAFEQLVSMSEETQRLADVEQRNQATEAQLRRRGAIMHAVGYAADRFLQAKSWRDNAPAVMEHLGRASEASRVTLFRVDTSGTMSDGSTPVCSWVDAAILPQLGTTEGEQRHVCTVCLADWQESLAGGAVIQRQASACGPGEMAELSRDQVLSLVVIPVFVEKEWWGIMSFEECRVEREWSPEEVEALRAAASTLGAAIGREAMEERIRLAKEKWERTFDAVPDLVYIVDGDSRIQRANRAMAERLGLSFKEIIGNTCHDLFHDASDASGECPYCRVLQNGTTHQMELPLERLNGTFLISVSPLGEDARHSAGCVHVARDITELKASQQALQEYSDKLQDMVEERTEALRAAQAQLVHREKLAVLGQLSGGVGHELRNPLGVISNAVYFLKTIQPDAPEKVKEYLDIISAEVSNAKRIVSQLLDFSRIRSTNPGKIAVRSLATKLIEKTPPPEGVLIEISIPADIPPVISDLDHLNQILSNLVVNAYQAMPRGGQLTIEAAIQGEMEASLTVRDTGNGISEENLAKVFEPLFTTKARGIGLGLTLSQNLAKANGGRIEAAGEEGKGAAFTVFLPMEPPATK